MTAIFPSLELDNVEKALIGLGVPGMTVSRTPGFGEYRNYYAKVILTDGVRVEIPGQVPACGNPDVLVCIKP